MAKKNKIGGVTNADAVVQKYLQAALVLDEHVAAAHGNGTADYMLVLANIVSNGVASEQDLQGMIGCQRGQKKARRRFPVSPAHFFVVVAVDVVIFVCLFFNSQNEEDGTSVNSTRY